LIVNIVRIGAQHSVQELSDSDTTGEHSFVFGMVGTEFFCPRNCWRQHFMETTRIGSNS